jgi:ABC-type nitrate/sulfonate/bicarbonate transport system substrate-binding protein
VKISHFLSWTTGAVLLVAGAAALAQEPRVDTIRVVGLIGRPLPVAVAEMHGTFAKYGVKVEVETVGNSDALRASLASGKSDIAHIAVDNAVAMVELSKADVVIVMGGEGSLNELIVQPGINSVSDLRGKTVIVDAPNTAYALQLKKILLLNGVQPGRDCEIKPVGATPQRLAAMREHKEYAGSMLGPPTSILARNAGFVSLGSAQKFIGPYQGPGAFVLRSWAREHAGALSRYLAAYIEAQRWLMAPANKQQVIELLEKESGLPPAVAVETYALLVQGGGGYQVDARFDVNAFKSVLNLRAEVEGQWGGRAPAAEKYFDLSYYEHALEKLEPPN